MISVSFTNDVEHIVATNHLYQWDNGQKLSISGINTSADIHFANKKSEKALVVTPTVPIGGNCVAPIPNSLLAEPYPIIAYVYVPSDDGSKTIKTITIPVETRPQPSDFFFVEDEGIITLDTISQRASEVIQYATNKVDTAVTNMNSDYEAFKEQVQSELDNLISTTTVPNADTLDFKHASDFMPAKSKCYNGADYNNYTSTGFYEVLGNSSANTKNAPNGNNSSNNFYLIVQARETGYCTQIATSVRTDKTIYVRCLFNGSWTEWTKINDGGNANTANTANKAGTLATTASNVCLRNISFGTAEPQVTDPNAEGYVAEGALYGQYE